MYRAPRGTTDILPNDQRYWTYVHSVARDVVSRYGYKRLDTPIFEQTDLFTRGVGEVTDIVEKEMYSFLDRGGDSITVLCKDCNQRFYRNPLRLLDCKQEICSEISLNAPRSVDYLCSGCKYHWDTLIGYLDRIELPYSIEHKLVRGLDYYTRTVFEIQPENAGSQGTILAGGRYDGLIEELQGKATPGIGFATGIERIILALKDQGVSIPEEDPIKFVLTYMGDQAKLEAVHVLSILHEAGINSIMAPSGKSLRAQMRYANNIGVSYVLVLGDEELENGSLVLKDMAGGSQRTIDLRAVVQELSSI